MKKYTGQEYVVCRTFSLGDMREQVTQTTQTDRQ